MTPPPDASPRMPSPDPVVRLARRFWIDWPRRILRRFPGSRGLAGDGHFLVTVPPLALLAPLATVAWFFFVGATRYGYEVVWSESLPLLVSLVALGTISGVLGVLGVTALALGDFVLGTTWQVFTGSVASDLLQVRVPMLITYLLLAVVVVVVPRTGRGLATAIGRSRRIPGALAWPIASVVVVLVAWIGTRTWAAAAPTLIRPRFTWRGTQPIVEAIAPLQEQATILVAVALVAAIVRQLWIGVTLVPGPAQRAMARAEARPGPATARTDRGGRPIVALPGPVRRGVADVTGAGLATLVLAGILEHVWLAALAYGVFLFVRLLRSGTVELPGVAAWKRQAVRLPAAVRLIVLWVIARVATNALAGGTIASYTGLALFVIAGSVVVWAVFPGQPRDQSGDGPSDRPPPPDPVPVAPKTARP